MQDFIARGINHKDNFHMMHLRDERRYRDNDHGGGGGAREHHEYMSARQRHIQHGDFYKYGRWFRNEHEANAYRNQQSINSMRGGDSHGASDNGRDAAGMDRGNSGHNSVSSYASAVGNLGSSHNTGNFNSHGVVGSHSLHLHTAAQNIAAHSGSFSSGSHSSGSQGSRGGGGTSSSTPSSSPSSGGVGNRLELGKTAITNPSLPIESTPQSIANATPARTANAKDIADIQNRRQVTQDPFKAVEADLYSKEAAQPAKTNIGGLIGSLAIPLGMVNPMLGTAASAIGAIGKVSSLLSNLNRPGNHNYRGGGRSGSAVGGATGSGGHNDHSIMTGSRRPTSSIDKAIEHINKDQNPRERSPLEPPSSYMRAHLRGRRRDSSFHGLGDVNSIFGRRWNFGGW